MESLPLSNIGTFASMRHYSPTLAMVIWSLSGVLIFCIIIRLLPRFKTTFHYHSLKMDDVLVVILGLIALASMFIMSTAVNLGFDAQQDSASTAPNREFQLRVFVSTILFVIVISLSRITLIIWLTRLKLRTVYQTCTMVMGCKVIACMAAITASVIFQCELPRPWNVQAGQCISLQAFWTVAIAIDITLDLALTVLPILAVMSMGIQKRSEIWAASVLSLRIFLIVPSLMRLVYLQQPISDRLYRMTPSQSYTIAMQCQITLAVVLSCTPALPCLALLVNLPLNEASVTLRKHWSGTTLSVNGSIDHPLSGPVTLVKEPLPAIQASMIVPPSSPYGSTVSLPSPVAMKYSKAPIRPPPPSECERPDMGMFTRRPVVKKPPIVTLLDNGVENTVCDTNRNSFYRVKGQAGMLKHVNFGV